MHAPRAARSRYSRGMDSQPAPGVRFSLQYLARGEPGQDSVRMRARVASMIYDFKDFDEPLGSFVTRELGVPVPYNFVYQWHQFAAGCELRDLLDFITVAHKYLVLKQITGFKEASGPTRWLAETQRIFSEENVHYRVDELGGVHFHFDEELARNTASAIAAVQGARYSNVRDAFAGSGRALSEVPPNGKAAVRATFSALEGLFRLMLPDAPRLGAKEAEALRRLLDKTYADDVVASRSAGKLLSSFKEWIDAAHFYRHELGAEEVSQPPLTLAVYLTSTGASHLRWLAELDALHQKQGVGSRGN
jgi:hypothetical protein